jgi:hypothetical protein
MNPNLQARLLAYKAYKLGRESASRGTIEEDDRFVRSCLARLKSSPPTAEIRRRRVFYILILAELHRLSDPVADREAAMQEGEQLESMGLPNPFPLYMRIIERTTRSPTTGNFGDLRNRATELIQDTTSYKDRFGNLITVDLAESALELSQGESAPHDRFIQKSLKEIAHLHGLVS